MALPPGTRLAQYEITATLGAGGMGEVYRARDLRLARDVAIKVMAEHIAADSTMRHRFETEAQAVAALSHPSIMAIHELGVAGGIPFAVMELLEGQSLRARLQAGTPSWREAVAMGAAVADGLAAAHVKGVIHRDLKPENIFLTTDGAVKILDFGLALHRFSGISADIATGVHTAPGVVLGTFGYMSPEQVTGARVDGRSDIFAAGCVIYEMLTGRQLFTGGTPQEVIANVLRERLPDLSAIDPAAPAELRVIVARCVDREPQRRFASAADLAMALRALLTGTAGRAPTGRGVKARGKSLAILPFVNSGGDPQIEYLTDGITESIINSLSQLPGLRVVPRSLVFRYKGLQTDPATVGLALNARTILTGHVVQQGDVLNIQAELVDTTTETQLWGERFRQKASELLVLQEEIAWQISEALRLKLTGAQKKKLRKRATVNPDAYQEYLRGRHHWHNWGPESFYRAIEHFERALAHDPAYAQAYAGLGNAYGALSYYGFMVPAEGFPRARAAALRALEMDPNLADAHVTLGLERLFFGWDLAATEASLKEALRLDPSSALANAVRSLAHIACGQFDEAMAATRRARALDPLSPFINMGVAWVHHFAGRRQEAERELLEILALKPGLEEAGNILITTYEALGKFEEAAAQIGRQRCWGLSLDGEGLLAAYRQGGEAAYWRERVTQMQRQAGMPPAVSFAFAIVHVQLGEFDQALDHIQLMVDHHVGGSVFVGIDPVLTRLRGMPRYDALVKRVGIPLTQMA
ncbi:MAG TPA: protein kinase [Vicinamibacterales bacterium]|nr:protein kinase [Vicinamibacterales bacterium]